MNSQPAQQPLHSKGNRKGYGTHNKGQEKAEESKQKLESQEESETPQAWAKGTAKQPDPVS